MVVLTDGLLQNSRRQITSNLSQIQSEKGILNPGPSLQTLLVMTTQRETRLSALSRCVRTALTLPSSVLLLLHCRSIIKSESVKSPFVSVSVGQQVECDIKLRDQCKGTTCNR